MANLSLTMACGPYDRTEALRNGAVQPEGIDLTYVTTDATPVLMDRALRDQEFDFSEMFLALHIARRSRGVDPFLAIPVFPSRVFRHGYIVINTNSGIKTPKDLEGKRVGLRSYRETAAVWIKGMLQHEYGVRLETIQWFSGGVNAPRRPDPFDVETLGPVSPQFIPQDTSLNDMLVKGELDAFLGAAWPASFRTVPHVKQLFPNYREVEREYYRKTGIFPIMHAVVVKKSVYQIHPWVAQSIFDAMTEAKKWVLEQLHRGGTLRWMLPWLYDDIQQLYDLMGPDPWPYGVEANRHTLETLMSYLVEQGLIPQPMPLEELFVPVSTDAQ